MKQLMESQRIFPSLSGPERQMVLENILETSSMIPSLWTFFENLKYLEPCCYILKQLVGSRKKLQKRTLREALLSTFVRPQELRFETSEGTWMKANAMSANIHRELSYQQLWLYTMRHFPEMTEFKPRKEPRKTKPTCTESNPALWHRLGALAVALGFRGTEARRLNDEDPDLKLSKQFLRHSEVASVDDSHAKSIANVLKSARRAEKTNHPTDSQVSLVSDTLTTNKEHRAGRPFEDSHQADKNSLFLPFLYRTQYNRLDVMTSFFVKQDMLQNFLGKVDHLVLENCTELQQSSLASLRDASSIDPPSTPVEGTSSSMDWQSENQSLKDENANLRNAVEQVKSALAVSRNQVEESRQNSENEQTSIQNLIHVNQDLRNEAESLQWKIAALDQDNGQLRADIDFKRRSLEELLTLKSGILTENGRLKARNTKLEEETRLVQESVSNIESANDTSMVLNKRVGELESEVATLRQNPSGSSQSASAVTIEDLLGKCQRLRGPATFTHVRGDKDGFVLSRSYFKDEELESFTPSLQKIVCEGDYSILFEQSGIFRAATQYDPAYLAKSWNIARLCWIIPTTLKNSLIAYQSRQNTADAVKTPLPTRISIKRKEHRIRRKRLKELDSHNLQEYSQGRVEELEDNGDTVMHEADSIHEEV